VNMLTTTAEYLLNRFGKGINIGLLATSGTIQSEVYHDVFQGFGFNVIIPDETRQRDVMETIYGEFGVKAGYTEGHCKALISEAVAYFLDQGVSFIILGCTELPLMFSKEDMEKYEKKGGYLIDPTLILAKK